MPPVTRDIRLFLYLFRWFCLIECQLFSLLLDRALMPPLTLKFVCRRCRPVCFLFGILLHASLYCHNNGFTKGSFDKRKDSFTCVTVNHVPDEYAPEHVVSPRGQPEEHVFHQIRSIRKLPIVSKYVTLIFLIEKSLGTFLCPYFRLECRVCSVLGYRTVRRSRFRGGAFRELAIPCQAGLHHRGKVCAERAA